LCPNLCIIPPLAKGACRARVNLEGKLFSLVYGKPCAVHVDPIEKKPMFHFLPGTGAFSIATAGCCLHCKYCQNWQISQADPLETPHYELPPELVVERALGANCRSIAYTYTDPIIFYEYVLDTAKIAQSRGVKNVLVTCGYIMEKPMKELTPFIDGANIDLKGFSEEFYLNVTGGKLKPVLDCIKYMYAQGVIVEITNLIVPTLNDDMGEIRKMCEWIKGEVASDVPLHFSRFQPQYKLANLPATPYKTLEEARKVALDVGLKYVYIGNVPQGDGQDTTCPGCHATIIKRVGYTVLENKVAAGACSLCGAKIYGMFD
jgi:pyruvate formate lyase activating enzyme